MSNNDRPLLMNPATRCSRMLPEPREDLRNAGASDHPCSAPPEFYIDIKQLGDSYRLLFCARHRAEYMRKRAAQRLDRARRDRDAKKLAQAGEFDD